MACMRQSVWTVNLPALHQYDKQWCGVAEKAGKAVTGALELFWWVQTLARIASLPIQPDPPVTFSLQQLVPHPACNIL